MAFYGLQGGFRDFMVFGSYIMVFRLSRCSLFSVVLCSFSLQYILTFACARKCSKVLPADAVGGAHFFIMHENKIHIG